MTLLKATAVSARKCCHYWPYHKRKWQIENAGRPVTGIRGVCSGTIEFSEKQCELQPAAPWLASLPCWAILLSPITIVILPHWDKLCRATSSSPEATLSIGDLQMKLLLRRSFSGLLGSLLMRIMAGQEPRRFVRCCCFLSMRRLRLAEEVFVHPRKVCLEGPVRATWVKSRELHG